MPGGVVPVNFANQSVLSKHVDLAWTSADVAAQETTTSTSFANLTTTGPEVTLTTGVTQDHLLLYSTRGNGNGANYTIVAPSIAGAAVVEDDKTLVWMLNVAQDLKWSNHHLAAAQVSGATHTQKYRVTAGTGTFLERRMSGIAI